MKNKKDSNYNLCGLALAILLFLLPALFSIGCTSEDEAPTPTERATAVRVASTQRVDLHQTLAYVGTVQFERTVRVSAQIPGVLDARLAPEGAFVERGDRLGRILAPELASRVTQVEAEIRRARAERDFVCGTLETDERLGEAGAIEPLRVETTRKNCSSATEAVRVAQARGVEVRTARGRTIEQAPDDGQVLRWLVEPGEYVGPGKPLAVLGTGRKLAIVQVSEPDLQRGVESGMAVNLRALGDEFEAVVSRVAPMMAGPSRSTTVEVLLPDELNSLAEGASVDVDLLLRSAPNILAISDRALIGQDKGARDTPGSGDERAFVFIDDDGTARKVAVTTGMRANGLIEISGLPDEARVVITQVRALEDGAPIFTVEALQ